MESFKTGEVAGSSIFIPVSKSASESVSLSGLSTTCKFIGTYSFCQGPLGSAPPVLALDYGGVSRRHKISYTPV